MASLIVLLPSRQRLAAVPELARGVLATWWTRGDRLPDAPAGRDAAVRQQFLFAGTAVPVAALTRQRDAGDAQGAMWLLADPAYARADMTTARLLAVGDLGLTPDECEALLKPLRPLFGDAGFPIDAPTPQRWYLRCAAGTQLPMFSAPGDVLGDDLGAHLPPGNEGRRWRSLFTEVQILLHQHPLNAERAQRGLPPVNALWFWGAGQLPEWVKSTLAGVISDDIVVQTLAERAKVPLRKFDPTKVTPSDGDVLVDLASLGDMDVLASTLTHIESAFARQGLTRVTLAFQSGERVVYRRAHRWRFWRRAGALPA